MGATLSDVGTKHLQARICLVHQQRVDTVMPKNDYDYTIADAIEGHLLSRLSFLGSS
jgi:hypothetical protein